jgi:hypothetical protein
VLAACALGLEIDTIFAFNMFALVFIVIGT